jgi:hypothetical protein
MVHGCILAEVRKHVLDHFRDDLRGKRRWEDGKSESPDL